MGQDMGSSTCTTCPYCGVGCGVIATPQPGGRVEITGDATHPANFGRLCSKGAALGETVSLDDRLLEPLIDGQRAGWDQALGLVAHRFAETVATHGPDSVAFYVSGQILTEDYYAANKLMKGFIGSANIDTNSRLCMASSVAGHKRAFGSDTVPGCYEDLDEADLVVLVGSNLAWCHPVLYQRLATTQLKRGTKVVVIDPRRTATCDIADQHLALLPGSDVALFNGLLTAIVGANAVTHGYVSAHTTGFRTACDAAMQMPLSAIARTTGLSQEDLHAFYDLFVRTERVVTVYSQGVNQSAAGTDKVNAIINCHLATGRIGKPGMGPFSVTGQPNAMGGREVGGLANMLAAHMELGDPEHRRIVQDFWRSPRIADRPGLRAVDMFRAVGDGRIKAIWIMGTNPVDSMPEADAVRTALAQCPFVVVSDVVGETDTTALAHVLLPSLAWGEKDGTVTNSERRISRQRAFLPAPGQARADWWQMAEVGRHMGFGDAFDWRTSADVFAEYVQLTATENGGRRDLDLGDLTMLSAAAYEALAPRQWPLQRARLFGDGRFFTPDGKARFVPTIYRGVASPTSEALPLVLNTGRIRDQWHTMTRTGKSARLMSHTAEPYIEMHPDDAARYGLTAATLAELTSPHGRAILRVLISDRQRLGVVFAPMHWTDQQSSAGRINTLIAGQTDPVSGQPELKAAPVKVMPFPAAWYGFAVLRTKPAGIDASYWALARVADGWRVELAGAREPDDWVTYARRLFSVDAEADFVVCEDVARGRYKFAVFDGEHLDGALFVGREPVDVARSWVIEKFTGQFADARVRHALVAGRAGGDEVDKGPIVCACFEIGRNQILDAVRGGCRTVSDVGAVAKAGTNCGSCRAEISRLIEDARVLESA